MEETAIDYNAVIYKLQLENELLRGHLKTFVEVRDAVIRVPGLLEDLWHKAVAHKMQLLIGLMILYWAASLALLFVDRVWGHP
jgi:hypothetical protein